MMASRIVGFFSVLLLSAPMANAFESADAAAREALRAAASLSTELEYAGVIYEKDGAIHYTKPVTSGETHSVKVRVRYPKGAKLLGLYHTHPAGMDSHIFAQGDVEISRQLKIPYYMGDLKNNSYSVFVPGESDIKRKLHGQPQVWSRGKLLGALTSELEPFKEAAESKKEPNLSAMFQEAK